MYIIINLFLWDVVVKCHVGFVDFQERWVTVVSLLMYGLLWGFNQTFQWKLLSIATSMQFAHFMAPARISNATPPPPPPQFAAPHSNIFLNLMPISNLSYCEETSKLTHVEIIYLGVTTSWAQIFHNSSGFRLETRWSQKLMKKPITIIFLHFQISHKILHNGSMLNLQRKFYLIATMTRIHRSC